MKLGYTIVYVPHVAESLAFFESAFGLSRRFLHESGDYGELETGETTLAFASHELGMQTFDQALFDLHEANLISYEEALRNADSVNDLRLRLKLESQHSKDSNIMAGLGHLRMT